MELNQWNSLTASTKSSTSSFNHLVPELDEDDDDDGELKLLIQEESSFQATLTSWLFADSDDEHEIPDLTPKKRGKRNSCEELDFSGSLG